MILAIKKPRTNQSRDLYEVPRKKEKVLPTDCEGFYGVFTIWVTTIFSHASVGKLSAL